MPFLPALPQSELPAGCSPSTCAQQGREFCRRSHAWTLPYKSNSCSVSETQTEMFKNEKARPCRCSPPSQSFCPGARRWMFAFCRAHPTECAVSSSSAPLREYGVGSPLLSVTAPQWPGCCPVVTKQILAMVFQVAKLLVFHYP